MKKQILLNHNQDLSQNNDTEIIQDALDHCRNWGGEVILGPGNWRISSIRMYSDTTLRLQSGCHLLGSTDYEDYIDWEIESGLQYLSSPEIKKLWHLPNDYTKAMITAADAENIAVIGELGSTINGQDCHNSDGEEGFHGPMGLVFHKCCQITLRGYTFTRCGNWAHLLDSCEDVVVDDIRIMGGHDGITVHHSKNIRIENCDLRTGDDCIAGYDAENILIRYTYLNSSCNCMRIGARNLLMQGCRFWGPGEYPHQTSGRHNTLSAFRYYSFIYDPSPASTHWVIEDCEFEDIDSIFQIDHGSCWDQNGSPLKDITLENCTMRGILNGSRICSVTPMDVYLNHIRMSFRDGIPETGICDTGPQVSFHLRDVHVQSL